MSDLVAALALVLVLEGLALVMLARSLPELLATLEAMDSEAMRWIGFVMLASGAVVYLIVRG
ncbi:MAG TPA: DUF2065 family protein [Thermohalobaculum sp.]|nr:DUF2065 family protein [Thermohalobaculum sp.]